MEVLTNSEHRLLPKHLTYGIPTDCTKYNYPGCDTDYSFVLEAFGQDSSFYITDFDGKRLPVFSFCSMESVCMVEDVIYCSHGTVSYVDDKERVQFDRSSVMSVFEIGQPATPNTESPLYRNSKYSHDSLPEAQGFPYTARLSVSPVSRTVAVSCLDSIQLYKPWKSFELKPADENSFYENNLSLGSEGCIRKDDIPGIDGKFYDLTYGATDNDLFVRLNSRAVSLLNIEKKTLTWNTVLSDQIWTIKYVEKPRVQGEVSYGTDSWVFCLHTFKNKVTVLNKDDGTVVEEITCPGIPRGVVTSGTAIDIVSYK